MFNLNAFLHANYDLKTSAMFGCKMFVTHELDANCKFLVGTLPDEVAVSRPQFDALWAMHPEEYHEIQMPGGLVKTPRWQQAYGADYHYTGRVNKALPVPPLLEPIHAWKIGRASYRERV